MAREPSPSITDADVRSLAAKLKGLHTLLTPPEQQILHMVLRRAGEGQGPAVADAGAFARAVRFNPFPYFDAVRPDEDP